MLDEDLNKKLRLKQAQMVRKTKRGVSFSAVLNETLRGCLKN